MPQKNRRKKQSVPRHLESSKQFERQQAAKVKAQLRSFAKLEYQNKKPKELRILRLKPQVIFKRGTMLPHLFITALQQTVYVIYLDYGEEIRFYFFDINGLSLGASTYSIGERGLQELHGKAKTLLKLPKLDPERHSDPQSLAVQKLYTRLIRTVAQRYHKSVPEMPVFSALKSYSLKSAASSSVRWGVRQEKTHKIAYIHPTLIDSQVIIRRELFVNFLGLDPRNETHQLIGTFWALAESSLVEIAQFLNLIPSQIGTTALHRKSFEWIRKKLQPKLVSDHAVARSYSHFIFQSTADLIKITGSEAMPILEMIPLWLMYENFESHTDWQEIADPLQGVWIMHELLSFIFSNPDLILSYKLQIFSACSSRKKWTWWILYLGGYFILRTHNLIPPTKHPIKLKSWIYDMISPSSMITAIETKKFTDFIYGLPSPLMTVEINLLSRMIKEVFSKTALVVSYDPITPIPIHHSRRVDITFENTSDLILYDVEFSVEAHPSSHLSVKIENPPRSTIFDTTMKFVLNITGMKVTTDGKGNVILVCHFRSWFAQQKREKMVLQEFRVKIEE